MVGIRPLSLVFFMLALLLPASASAEPTTRIIVKRDPGLSTAEQRDLRADAGVRHIDTMLLPRTEVVAAPADEAEQAVRELNRDPDVVYAQIDHKRRVAFDRMPRQWALENTAQSVTDIYGAGLFDADVDAPEAWAQFATGTGQQVAVVDTGIDDTLADLNGQVVAKRTFIGTGPDVPDEATDGDSHGTHVAGIIAARTNDNATQDANDGIVGVAPDAQLMALKALDDEGAGFDSDIADAMVYAGENGVRVVNLSLGGSDPAPALDAAIQAEGNTLFVVAAGNEGTDNNASATPSWPCNSTEANVICVGASTNNDRVADFSNFGATTVDLFAPGYQILSTVPAGTFPDFPTSIYGYKAGTSMAAPHVAAAAALLLEISPAFTIGDVKQLILAHVDHRDAFAGKSVTGGRLNVGAAVAFAKSFPAAPADADGDGVIDAIDKCPADLDPMNPPKGTDGCEVKDTDDDTTLDPDDNCPGIANDQAADDDQDGEGNACDDSPRGPDVDKDGKPALDDACPTVYGTQPNGCPPPVVTVTPSPTPTPTPAPPPVDSDGDGFYNPSDACPFEYARTSNGCPVPSVTSLSARAKKRHGKRSATISVRASRAAVVEVTVQIRKCRRGHCRWARVTRKTTSTVAGRATVTATRLNTGRYRAVVVLSSTAGRAKAETQSFRVR
jgi:thermitase